MASIEAVPACLLAAPPPVVQPPHLEGDSTLATEILPGPPSLVTIQQLGLPKKDHKKSVVIASYLPASDPGTTYGANTVSTMATSTEVDGPRRKRARLEKGSASSRAQRASARNMAATTTSSDTAAPAETLASSSTLPPEADSLVMQVDSDDAEISRANSLVPMTEDQGPVSSFQRSGARREKGKGKESVKGNEEPGATSGIVVTETVGNGASSNEDHCSACRSLGSLVYCDGCPRAYHLWCLNPPMEAEDLPAGDARWFCPSCSQRQKPASKSPQGLKFMAPLVEQIDAILPAEYSLPSDVRTFFKDVSTGPKGNFVDSSELKPPRLNRHGQLEEREPYRLRDRNGEPVLCFRCGTSALPPDLAAAAPATKRARRATSTASNNSETGSAIISCDYCHLNWHLDCVEPPLAYMPPWNKKWMCPNHVDQILPLKRRIPKTNASPIEITKSNQYNNGNIEVIQPETPSAAPPKLVIDEVLINGRRYRVPERVITMDFWKKAGKSHHQPYHFDLHSIASSPLSSLSSLSDDEMHTMDTRTYVPPMDLDELRAAVSLCDLFSTPVVTTQAGAGIITDGATITAKVPPQTAQKVKNGIAKPKVIDEAVPMAVDEKPDATDQASDSGLRRSGRSSVGRRLRPWNKPDKDVSTVTSYLDELDDLSEDYQPHASASTRKPKRQPNGKFARKVEGKDKPAKATDQPVAVAQDTAPAVQEQPPVESSAEPLATSSSRPKRNRQPSRRRESPTPIASAKTGTSHASAATVIRPPVSPLKRESEVAPTASVSSNSTRRSSLSPDVPLRKVTSAASRSNAASSSTAPITPTSPNPTVLPTVTLNVPAITTLHPSLRYKPIAPAASDSDIKMEAPTPKVPAAGRQKPASPVKSADRAAGAADKTAVQASSSKLESSSSSSGLKIRLPRMGGALPPAPPPPAHETSPTRAKTQNTTRPRRSLRRRSSMSTSLTGTSLSAPSSPKMSGLGA